IQSVVTHIIPFLVGFFGYLLLCVCASPTKTERQDLIGDVINAVGLGLVTKINAYITAIFSRDFSLTSASRSLSFELTFERVVSKAGVNRTVYASFDHTFATPVVVGGPQTVICSGIYCSKKALRGRLIIPTT
ncbi:hypothetical protein CVT25_003201, partial [Psilocybe cyanescens]